MRLKRLSIQLDRLNKFKFYFFFYLFLFFFNFSFSSFACQNINYDKSEILIVSKKNKKQFKFYVEVADNEVRRKKGLQCRKILKKNEGMLFIWKFEDHRYFWMKNTNLFLDIIFINSDLEIVDIFFNAKPYDLTTIKSEKKAKFVLELKAGIFKKLNLNIGDRLFFKKLKKIVSKKLILN